MSNCNHHKNRFEIKLLKNIYDWDFCRNLHIACTDILALWLITYDSAHAQISAGQARASRANYQGRRLPCWVRDVVAQLFFKASNKVRTIALTNYQIETIFLPI